MKRCVIGLVLLWPTIATAQVRDFLKTVALTTAGAGTAILTHEAGHQLAAWGTDTPMHWNTVGGLPDGTWHAADKKSINVIVLSGWAAEGLGAEALLASPIKKSNPFVVGYTNGYVVHMGQYIIRSAVTSGGFRDFHHFTPAERNVLSVTVGIHLALVAWRIWQPDGLPEYLQTTFNGLEWRW